MSNAQTVFVFRWQDKTPVYHLPDWMLPKGGTPRELDSGGEEFLTACGKVESRWDPSSRTEWKHIAQKMRLDHAVSIGRPCASCAQRVNADV